MKKTLTDKLLTALAGIMLSFIVFIGTPAVSMAYTQATGIVSADAAKVRKEPSTSSDAVAGLLKGSTVIVTDEVTDSAGMVWYKVTVEGNAGYIRSDLLIKSATPIGNTNTVTNSNTTDNSQAVQPADTAQNKPQPTTATPIAETKAYVNYESARIREGASTEHEPVGSAAKNTAVTITGEAKSNDGKLWYQIKYTTSAGREVVGFIRGDLLTIGEPPVVTNEAPTQEENTDSEGTIADPEAEGETSTEGTDVAEPEVPEEPIEEPVEEEVKPDYEMVYTPNNEGENEWFLYDNIAGTRQTLTGLMAAAEAGAAQDESDSKLLSTQKIIIIVLAVVVAIFAVTVTLLLFKIKDLYDYEEDEEEDDDEEEEEDDDEEEEIPVRKRSSVNAKQAGGSRERTSGETVKKTAAPKQTAVPKQGKIDYDFEKEKIRSNTSASPSSQSARKAKNFLIDDDEFEFEFLNMDDKE